MRFIFTWLVLVLVTHLSAQDPTRPPQVYVNAGDDQEISLPVNQVKLEAKVDAPRNVTYSWQQVSGPSEASISTPSQLSTTVGKLSEAGIYHFAINVLLNERLIGVDSVSISVRYGNTPPVADAGPDVTVFSPQNSLSIQGNTDDYDDEGVYTQWSQISGPTVNMDQDGALLLLSNLVVGRYQFELVATDEAKSEDRDVMILTVRSPNQPPSVNAGNDVTISLPNNTVLIGSATDDKDVIENFRWRQLSGPSASIVSPTKRVTLAQFPSPGRYSFVLIATDNDEARGADTVLVTVKAQIPPQAKPPVAIAGPDQTVKLPESVVLSGRAIAGGSPIESFFWTKTGGSDTFEITNPQNARTTVTGLVEGEYIFELLVIDSLGSPDRDLMKVIVVPADTVIDEDTVNVDSFPPKVEIGADITITSVNQIVEFFPDTSDVDGRIVNFTWAKTSGPEKGEINSSSVFNANGSELPNQGEYVFRLTVEDDDGLTSFDTVTITLAIPPPPINWALIAIIALGSLGVTAAASKYYFGILPPGKKVLVYYLDKSEEAFVDSIMPNAEKTESYAVGRSNASDIKKLRKRNIAVLVLNTNNLVVNTPGRIQTYNYEKKKGFKRNVTTHSESVTGNEMVNLVGIGSQQQSEIPAATFPSFTIITLDGPLLPTYEKQLTDKGIQILQHVPINSYIIRVYDASQLNALKDPAFNFIRMSQPYSPEDTGLIVRDQHFRNALQTNDALTLDLLLHREDDRSTVLQFLEKLPITILEWYRNRIRISAPANAILGLQLSQHTSIQAIYEFIPPEWTNDVARQLIGIDKNIAGECAITETGEGEIVGVADSGIDQKHTDLIDQVAKAVSWGRKKAKDTSDPIGHGTHVAASIAGNGAASGGKIKGMAPGAKLFFQSLINTKGELIDFGLRMEELFQEAYDAGARIHNNSWGAPGESRYTIDTIAVDDFIYEHPDMLIVFAVGNNGCYDKKSAENGYVGNGSISSPATMKNGLSVGASRNKRTTGGYADKSYGAVWKDRFPFPPTSTESVSGDPEGIAAFSARGQCDDFRMKPDIVAPGTDILSARSGDAPHEKFHGPCADYNDAYAYLGGTSMSAPIVAGAAALVREYYKKQRNCQKPSAALIKATLINGARKLSSVSAMHGGDIPNANQGYGMLDMVYTIPNSQQQFQLHFHDSLTDPKAILKKGGEGFKTNMRLSSTSWIRVCLAFTDFPARGIQSDLDLIIEYHPTKQKWSGNRKIEAEESNEIRVADRTNNLEIVRLTDAQPGSYTVHVIAHNLLNVTQGFALVITTGDMGAQFG